MCEFFQLDDDDDEDDEDGSSSDEEEEEGDEQDGNGSEEGQHIIDIDMPSIGGTSSAKGSERVGIVQNKKSNLRIITLPGWLWVIVPNLTKILLICK